MVNGNNLAYTIKQKEIDYEAADLTIMQVQILNRRSDGKIMVERIPTHAENRTPPHQKQIGKYHIPGISLKFGEHPEEAAHRVLTEELEVADRDVKLIDVQSHIGDKNHWYILFLFESEPLTEKEMANPCEGIEEILYLDLDAANEDNSTNGLRDIREAIKRPGVNYV